MSATPRTDAAVFNVMTDKDLVIYAPVVHAILARQLETELQEAQKENERIKSLEGYRAMGKQIADALDERDQLRQQLTEAQAAIGVMKSVIEMAWEDRREDSPVEYIGKLAEAKCNQPNCGQPLLEVVKGLMEINLVYAQLCEEYKGSAIVAIATDRYYERVKQTITKAKEIGL